MPHAAAERQLVVFSLHGEEYGLPVEAVREIMRYTAPSATAAAGGLVEGMINVGGRVLPVVDLLRWLGRTVERDSSARIIVVELKRGPIGVIVDAVKGILAVRAEQVEPLPVTVAADALGTEIAAVGERLIMLVDPERALGDVLPPRRPTARRAPARRTPAQSTSAQTTPAQTTPAQTTPAKSTPARSTRTRRAKSSAKPPPDQDSTS